MRIVILMIGALSLAACEQYGNTGSSSYSNSYESTEGGTSSY